MDVGFNGIFDLFLLDKIVECPSGSLSALIYQHSVTPLALPIKLVLPENDLMLKDGSSTAVQSLASPTTQLLTQGAACSLLYLFTMDTESLTGPQAIQRTMTHLLDAKPLPVPTIVHFKVSSQGITLTDNERKLFFR
jgi:tensin